MSNYNTCTTKDYVDWYPRTLCRHAVIISNQLPDNMHCPTLTLSKFKHTNYTCVPHTRTVLLYMVVYCMQAECFVRLQIIPRRPQEQRESKGGVSQTKRMIRPT